MRSPQGVARRLEPLVGRLRRAYRTASNDDASKRRTPERERHVERLAVLEEAREAIEEMESAMNELTEALCVYGNTRDSAAYFTMPMDELMGPYRRACGLLNKTPNAQAQPRAREASTSAGAPCWATFV